MATGKYLTILTVLRDGSHVLYQTTDTLPGHTGVRIGSHIALRQKDYGGDVATVVIVHGDTVTEHRP
jgi:predicted RNA binding protein YcfA (HicA-like mRNA interferase family)